MCDVLYDHFYCVLVLLFVCFFFFKQKTAYEMRISDWSSDVCSSDLIHDLSRIVAVVGMGEAAAVQRPGIPRLQRHRAIEVGERGVDQLLFGINLAAIDKGIGVVGIAVD